MASGLIYLIIIGMWVAYFLPRWISTHEDSSGRTGEKFKSAMRVVGESSSALLPEYQDPAKKRKVIAQRRAVFSGLSALLVGTSIIALLGFIAWSLLLIPSTALAIYLVNVRRQVVASQLKARRLKALEKVTTMPVRISQEFISASQNNSEHWIPLSERNELSGVVVIPKDRTGWQPVSVPRPTYVTAAKAITPKRVIDLTVPGTWSAEQEIINNLSLPSRDGVFDQELAEQAAVDNSSDRVVNE
ncbi:MAG: hypothetical protein RL414_375 [Actinomycetota bacterium]|jgi:hypothetical protein